MVIKHDIWNYEGYKIVKANIEDKCKIPSLTFWFSIKSKLETGIFSSLFSAGFKLFYPKGLTVTTDEAGKVIVARIIINSYIERQGLLRPGDLILEANGERVKNPEQV